MSAMDKMLGRKPTVEGEAKSTSPQISIMQMLTNPGALQEATGQIFNVMSWFKTHIESIELKQDEILTLLKAQQDDRDNRSGAFDFGDTDGGKRQ